MRPGHGDARDLTFCSHSRPRCCLLAPLPARSPAGTKKHGRGCDGRGAGTRIPLRDYRLSFVHLPAARPSVRAPPWGGWTPQPLVPLLASPNAVAPAGSSLSPTSSMNATGHSRSAPCLPPRQSRPVPPFPHLADAGSRPLLRPCRRHLVPLYEHC